jgi:DNA-damage-inducible protein J
MTKTANLNIRIDPQTKQGAEQLFSVFGITLSDAVTIFLRQSLLEGGLPFEMKQPRVNGETEAAMQEARDIMSGRVKAKSYKSAKELAVELKAELAAELEAEC